MVLQTDITRIEHRGFTIDALKVTHATADQLHQHYAALVGEPFFPRIERFMTGGPMVAMIVSGFNVIEAVRKMTGAPPKQRPARFVEILAVNGPTKLFATSFTVPIVRQVPDVKFQSGSLIVNTPLISQKNRVNN